MRRRLRSLPLMFTLAAGGCASAAAGRDLEVVRRLAEVPALPDVTTAEVDPVMDDQVRRLLAQPLDVETAVRIALRNNRMLRANLRQLGVARGQLVQAGLLPNPHLELEKPVEPEVKYEVGIEVNLTDAVLAPLRGRAAAAELDAERYRAAGAVIDLGLDVRAAFFAVQAAGQRLALARQSLDALAASRDAARALERAGNTSKLLLANQEAAYERARVLVAAGELEVATTRERLQRLMGLHGRETAWTTAGRLATVAEITREYTGVESRAVEKSLQLAEARARLEALARQSGLSRAEGWLPDVEVSGRAAELSGAEGGHGGRRYGAGVTLSIPLFDRNQGNTAALAARFDSALERYHATAVDVRSAAREADARLVSARARARQYETVILPAQRRLTRETLLRFNAMQVGIFQLLVARREELDVELAYVDALRDFWTADARMDAILRGGGGSDFGPASSAGVTFTSSSSSQGGH
jgi:outer membrane protein, heavy metal efflux system